MQSETSSSASYLLNQYLSGAVAADSLPPDTLSWSRFFIYKRAVEILKYPSIEDRREAAAREPEHLREAVKKEVLRVWELRKKSR